jgi:hypothetical protein
MPCRLCGSDVPRRKLLCCRDHGASEYLARIPGQTQNDLCNSSGGARTTRSVRVTPATAPVPAQPSARRLRAVPALDAAFPPRPILPDTLRSWRRRISLVAMGPTVEIEWLPPCLRSVSSRQNLESVTTRRVALEAAAVSLVGLGPQRGDRHCGDPFPRGKIHLPVFRTAPATKRSPSWSRASGIRAAGDRCRARRQSSPWQFFRCATNE